MAIASGKARVELTEDAWSRIIRSRKVIDNILSSEEVVYGINTGFGSLVDTIIPPDQLQKLQVNLIRSHATGLGEKMDKDAVRAMMVARINSFAKGDKKSLKDLLTKEMRQNFESAIEERNKNNIKSELTFIGVKSSVVENFEKTATALFFTVKFVSEIISVKRDKDNNVIEGDPNKIKTVIDKWKFTRPTSSMSPNWYLAEIKNS